MIKKLGATTHQYRQDGMELTVTFFKTTWNFAFPQQKLTAIKKWLIHALVKLVISDI